MNKEYQIIYHPNFLIEVIRLKGKKGNKPIYSGFDIVAAYMAIINDLGGKIENINGRM